MFEFLSTIIQSEKITMAQLLLVGLIGVIWIVLWRLPQIIEQYRLFKKENKAQK